MNSRDFPHLTLDNHRVTSPATSDYNCIAWSAGDTTRWWQPGIYWPVECSIHDTGIDALRKAFASLGFTVCETSELEIGFEKVALYGNDSFYTHAARLLENGKWTSKLGRAEDIEHDTADAIAGGLYGEIVAFMKRPIPS